MADALLVLAHNAYRSALSSPEAWAQLLQLSGHYYKYTPYVRLLLAAQAPEATFVARAEIWTEKMGRTLKPDACAIPAADRPKGRPYRLFDVKDTFAPPGSKAPNPWVLTDPELVAQILGGESVPLLIRDLAKELGTAETAQTIACTALYRCGLSVPLTWLRASYQQAQNWGSDGFSIWLQAGEHSSTLLARIGKIQEKITKGEYDNEWIRTGFEEPGSELRGHSHRGLEEPSDLGAGRDRSQDGHDDGQLRTANRVHGGPVEGVQPSGNAVRETLDAVDAGTPSLGDRRDDDRAYPGSDSAGDREQGSGPLDRAASPDGQADPGTDRGAEEHGHDALGGDHEQYPLPDGGDRSQRTDPLRGITEQEAEASSASPISAEADPASAFLISGEIIDAVLARGSGVHEGKLRIFEQYALGQSEKENAAFLKQEYGIGGAYPALTVDGQDVSEDHDSTGIRLRVGMSGPIKKITWSEAAKRIGRLISDGRYLNEQERAAYAGYLSEKAEQAKRGAVADRFRGLVREYAADHDALNLYVLSDCADAFTTGRKTTWTLTQGNWILPLMRSALQQIVADGTPEQQQAAIDLLKALQRPEAAALEPSEEELHPAISVYKISVQPGDSVWINGRERQIVSVTGEEKVSLSDPDFPLFTEDLLWDDFRREMLADCRNNPFTVILEHREMTQAEIDDAICKWNGSEQSKGNVIRYLKEHVAESGAAAWLAREYGTEKPLHFTVTGTDADVVLEWPEIQSRLISLIANGSFHADSGFDTPAKAAPAPVEESQKKADSEPKAEETGPREYRVGDTMVLDGTAYTVEKVGMFDVTMSAGGQPYPVSRVESKENLERLLRLPENNHLHNLVVSLSSPVGSNFHFQSLDRSAGPKDQFRKNLDAVALLRTLQAEGRAATADEQAILARYAGWGGLAAAFDEQNESWSKEYKELQDALTPGEYLAARASTLDAHYTAPEIIRGMYAVLENMGFSGGNILEPAAGIGNFLGAAPEDLAGRSRFHAVELDPLSGEILKKLYPGADVTIGGFETTKAKNTYDLAIGNVPFGQIKVNDPELNRYNFSIHNYFFGATRS